MRRLSILAALALSASAGAAPLPPVRVILVGDSTVASNNGYGDALCARFSPEVDCVNLGANGRSSKSFRAEGRWDKVLELLQDDGKISGKSGGKSGGNEGGKFAARYVLVQFGHNDQPGKRHATDLVAEFPANMARYAADVRALGGVPVLVTPLTRRTFKGAYLRDTLAPWAAATRRAAAAENVAVIDLNTDSAAAVQAMGQAEADTLAEAPAPPPSPDGKKVKSKFDWTHLGPKGSALFGAMVGNELKRAVPAIAPYLPPGDRAARD
ncbi:rhamnogalacturonan acetylesterase [Pseudoduganella umbonata]|uniref:Lysophospholipase L1-like esterase n=1 Tax=Pseudoduganella umbonata TaxID=864828 RepID=A0A4P8HW67_9BURK|nr:rhamnogalacturonan acetylesterase [Pseudoduganella umbonata]MBB3221940.1 lysophospholipase L1-like esterase [Pseudoduganella umbonata]QCP14263.1 rhamnogalacturonan acetylesterase [Pseudoduganella umbonata]